MVYDAYMQVANIRTRYNNWDDDNIYEKQFLKAYAHKFYDILVAATEYIYDGATESKLSTSVYYNQLT